MEIIIDTWNKLKNDASTIRYEVFVKEQGFSELTEITDLDDKCIHCVIYLDKIPIGTARLSPDGQLGRICVLQKYRNKKIGTLLINALKKTTTSTITLNAQTSALEFYKKNGFFIISGSENIRTGIPHIKMTNRIQ